MKNTKTKIKFTDIAGMLDRDEMKAVIGGSGSTGYSSGTALGGGFTGGYVAQSSFNGSSYSYASGSSYSSYTTAIGYTTSNPKDISALYGMLTTSQPPTDCFFQCLGWISAMNGDFVHDANYYASVYAFTNPNTGFSVLGNFLAGVSSTIPYTGGMPQNQAFSFSSIFFNTTNYSGASSQVLSSFINTGASGNPNGTNQLICIYSPPSGGLHAVAVTSIVGIKLILLTLKITIILLVYLFLKQIHFTELQIINKSMFMSFKSNKTSKNENLYH